MTGQLGRQAQLDRVAIPEAGSDQHAVGQQPGSAIEHRGCAAGPRIEAGRVDHQHRSSVAAQEPTPGQSDRVARRATFRQTRLLHALQPLHWRQSLRLGETGQRAGEGFRGGLGAPQGGSVRVEPRRQHLQVAHDGAPSLPDRGSARM